MATPPRPEPFQSKNARKSKPAPKPENQEEHAAGTDSCFFFHKPKSVGRVIQSQRFFEFKNHKTGMARFSLHKVFQLQITRKKELSRLILDAFVLKAMVNIPWLWLNHGHINIFIY